VNDQISDKSGFRMLNLRPVVEWSSFASLDRFIHKNIFFCFKQSGLAGPFEKRTKIVRISNGPPFC
jgi:hypothetical protein